MKIFHILYNGAVKMASVKLTAGFRRKSLVILLKQWYDVTVTETE